MKKFIFSVIFLTVVADAFSQVPPDYRFVKTWHISDRFATVDSVPVDTMHLNYQNDNPIDRFSIANSFNGNLGSPIQSKLYFDRPENSDFIFATPYYPYLMNVQHVTFYNTKTPFSNLGYITGGTGKRDEDNFKFLFTANANKKLNFGTTIDYLSSPGEYMTMGVSRFSGSLFGSYDGKHYTAKGMLATNSMKNQESGGLKNPADILTGLSASIMPVNMAGQSNFTQNVFYYNQQYSIGIERPVRINQDSVRMDYVPVTRFGHTFKYDDVRKRYYENSVERTFYRNTYGIGTQTKDTASLQTITNNLSISMEEEFNKWMQFGLTAYLENEIQRYVYTRDNVLNLDFMTTTKVGGVLSKQRGRRFRYNVLGELSFLGYKAGNVLLEGNVGGFFKLWKDSISLVANGFVRSDKPSWYLSHYESNHFRWDNDFANVYRTHVGGTFSIPTRSLSLDVSVENITQYVYFDSLAMPTQHAGNIQVLALNLKKDFHLGKFALENNVVYQVSSVPEPLPLPNLVLFHNLYYDDKWFNVLSVQLGANVRYHTMYYAPSYMPATGQFYAQSTTKVGNYPVLNVYANFHLKRTRFFIQYYHLNNKFMKGDYFSMPGYPINPAIIKTGISWNFYD
ncbi:MAG: putative porin [Paludibacter sp.]